MCRVAFLFNQIAVEGYPDPQGFHSIKDSIVETGVWLHLYSSLSFVSVCAEEQISIL